MTALVEGVFLAAQVGVGVVAVEVFEGAVGVALLDHGGVVAGEDDEGVVVEAFLFEGVDHARHAVVELLDDVAVEACARPSAEGGRGHAGFVGVVGGVVEEEGCVAMSSRCG